MPPAPDDIDRRVIAALQVDARAFERAVDGLPEIVSCWSTAGDSDFVPQVVARDLDHNADFAMNTVRRLPGIRSMRSVITLKGIKVASSWPLPGSPSSAEGE
ncbi:Lrp/AsnC ligand binding domain-containing protein [Actinomyces sp.]|uniref:Lrp/AsnC ligand binding domain-containing protein n=1 Tax=Actinomyces sp. TaxID=29317 RepID=UPI00289A76D7|nr:Lrp/AsnC ligand binding domain-containing protein [Actinomyces sp.]